MLIKHECPSIPSACGECDDCIALSARPLFTSLDQRRANPTTFDLFIRSQFPNISLPLTCEVCAVRHRRKTQTFTLFILCNQDNCLLIVLFNTLSEPLFDCFKPECQIAPGLLANCQSWRKTENESTIIRKIWTHA